MASILNPPEVRDSEHFRQLSKAKFRSPSVKRGSGNTIACHKVPNKALYIAYTTATSRRGGNANMIGNARQIRRLLLEFAHSKDNIFYSQHNDEHSRSEQRLQTGKYTSADIRLKGRSIGNALNRLYRLSKLTCSHVLLALLEQGRGYLESVAVLDREFFSDPLCLRVIAHANQALDIQRSILNS